MKLNKLLLDAMLMEHLGDPSEADQEAFFKLVESVLGNLESSTLVSGDFGLIYDIAEQIAAGIADGDIAFT